MAILRNLTLFVLIVVIQLGSFGFVLNKHYCKGKLAGVSVLISSQGCAKDLSFVDRFFLLANDCQMPSKEGLTKTPCCEFLSHFTKINVYQESGSDWSLNVQLAILTVQVIPVLDVLVEQLQSGVELRPPPLISKQIFKQYCSFLI